MESLVLAPVLIAFESNGQLVTDGDVGQGREGRGMSTVQPTLLERPERRDDEVVFPVRGCLVQGTARLQVDSVASQGNPRQ